MATVNVIKLDNETYARLRARATRQGVSVEEEARHILEEAVAEPESLGDLALTLFGPEHGIELELLKRGPQDPMSFSE